MGALLAQIAMIAEEVNVLALAGASARRTYDEQLACFAEVKRRLREMLGPRSDVGTIIDVAS